MLSTAVKYRELSSKPKHISAGGKQQNNGEPLTAEEVVQLYRNSGNKLGVLDMRRFMKTLVAEVFLQDKFSGIHKCRGIWKQKPSDWDPNVPFADPNNAQNSSNNQKPSKKTLKEMMSYLVHKYEETKMQVQDEKKPLAPATQTTLGGNICTQPSDWDTLCFEDRKLEPKQEESDAEHWVQEPICSNPQNITTPSQPVMESQTDELTLGVALESQADELTQGVAMEELDSMLSTIGMEGGFDIVHFTDPENGNQQQEEVGVSHDNYNVQMQNMNAEIVREVPVLQPADFPPMVAAQQAPPPSRQMEGVPVSNAGELGFKGGSMLGEGEKMDNPENTASMMGQNTEGDLLPELGIMDLNALEDYSLPDLDGYIQITNYNDIAWTDMQEIPVDQTQHPTTEGTTFNQPMVETEGSQNIPTFVMDYDAMDVQ